MINCRCTAAEQYMRFSVAKFIRILALKPAEQVKYTFLKQILRANYHKSARARRQTKGTVFTLAYRRYY